MRVTWRRCKRYQLQQGIPRNPTHVLWVRGPSGPLPPEAAK